MAEEEWEAADAVDIQHVGSLLNQMTRPTHRYLLLFLPAPGHTAFIETVSKIEVGDMPALLRHVADNIETEPSEHVAVVRPGGN